MGGLLFVSIFGLGEGFTLINLAISSIMWGYIQLPSYIFIDFFLRVLYVYLNFSVPSKKKQIRMTFSFLEFFLQSVHKVLSKFLCFISLEIFFFFAFIRCYSIKEFFFVVGGRGLLVFGCMIVLEKFKGYMSIILRDIL